jgi:Ner family transcriptional regulator
MRQPKAHRQSPDWHREDIKAAVRKTGITLEGLCAAHGLDRTAINRTLRVSWPRVEAIIAARLGLRPWQIWPSRYDESGNPLRGGWTHQNRSSAGRAAHRQKREAA